MLDLLWEINQGRSLFSQSLQVREVDKQNANGKKCCAGKHPEEDNTQRWKIDLRGQGGFSDEMIIHHLN